MALRCWRQVLVVFKLTGEAIPDRYEDERRLHTYDVVVVWQQDPAKLLKPIVRLFAAREECAVNLQG